MCKQAGGASDKTETGALPEVTAILLAGGIGSRLKDITDLPKPIVPVFGKPFLFYLLQALKLNGIDRAIICAGYRSELVIATMQQWNPGLDLTFSIETTAMGTGGASRLAAQHLKTELALLMNGDSLCDFDLKSFVDFQRQHPGHPSMVVTPVADCSRYGRVLFSSDGKVDGFEEKNPLASEGWINAGVYLIPAGKLRDLPAQVPLSLEREVFPLWLGEGIHAFPVHAPFLDIGTPDSYLKKEAFVEKITQSQTTIEVTPR